MVYDAVVIGGGLAGSSVALQLARCGHEVVLLEKDSFPRHKLCGEFLSPEVQSSLRDLGLLTEVHDAGAQEILHARLSGPRGTVVEQGLPDTALGLSRYRLDSLLFDAACEAGVDARQNTKATDVEGSLQNGFVVQTNGEAIEGRLVLGAYGRRGILDRTLQRPFLQKESPYVAFKAHYRGPTLPTPGTVEVHAAEGGYCGIGPVEDGLLNVCWIGRVDQLKASGGTPSEMLSRGLRTNPVLDDRLADLSRVSDGFEAVSQVPLMAKEKFVDDVCMIGDAAGMIAPLCGDGMAMALDTADLVAAPADEYLSGVRSAASFRTLYRNRWNAKFGRRLRIGHWVHSASFRPVAASALLKTCRALPFVTRWLIQATRGSPSSGSRPL